VSDFEDSKRKNANSKFVSLDEYHHSQQQQQALQPSNFRKKNLDSSYEQVEKSNVFNNNRLSVTRILNNS
jgi:hypothetical protein